jgi:hypothetical protein
LSPRDVARVVAAGRVAVGAALLIAPRLSTRLWLGSDAVRPGVRVIARALGVRDLTSGIVALHTIDAPDVGARWLRTLAAIDAVDFAATLAARRDLPRGGVALVAAMAGAGVAGQLWAANGLDQPAGESPPVPAT